MTQDIEKQSATPAAGRTRRRWAVICTGILLIFLLLSGIMVGTALRPVTAEAGTASLQAEDFACCLRERSDAVFLFRIGNA